jgi:hypothetical protein
MGIIAVSKITMTPVFYKNAPDLQGPSPSWLVRTEVLLIFICAPVLAKTVSRKTPYGPAATRPLKISRTAPGRRPSNHTTATNPVSAVANITSKTTGNTSVSIAGSAFIPGAEVNVLSNSTVVGATQSIGDVLGGGNTASVSGFKGQDLKTVGNILQSMNSEPTSAVSNVLNQTTGNFDFQLSGDGIRGQGGLANLNLNNGATVMGGQTTTGVVSGSTSTAHISK